MLGHLSHFFLALSIGTMTFLFVLPRSYKKWDDECKKWDDEWVTVLTTTSTAVLKNDL